MMFWLLAGGLLALVMGQLVWAALRGSPTPVDTSSADYLRSQTTVLARATQAGEISEEHRAVFVDDTARATLEDAAAGMSESTPRTTRVLATLVIAVLLPAVALPVYWQLGTPGGVNPSGARPHPSTPEMVAELNKRISGAPTDPEPRLWLARVYLANGQPQEAIQTFAALYALAPNDPTVLIQYADALAIGQEGKLAGLATELIQRVLALEPDNVIALWLAGIAAEQAGDPNRALQLLLRAKQASAGTEIPTEELDGLIAEVQARGGVEATSTTKPSAGTARITVEINVAPEIRAQFAPTSTVFVVAKTPTGPQLPRAVVRLTLAELPTQVVLDDSHAMSPQFQLSDASEVNVIARISRSGNAIAASGDVEGTVGPLIVGPNTTATVVLTKLVP
ncbi:MAG: c-type cytochrome biogenesis protein CcmI [Gammaproteobacteria bacterium]|nr:c-type cytochrome biogenesis protein CcmI [Gammaproteobacteria bacterium]